MQLTKRAVTKERHQMWWLLDAHICTENSLFCTVVTESGDIDTILQPVIAASCQWHAIYCCKACRIVFITYAVQQVELCLSACHITDCLAGKV